MGSHSTGDDLTAGETNGANNMTMIIADNGRFDGAIFSVVPTGELGSGPEQTGPVQGIIGIGYQGGAGVKGRGDSPDLWLPGGVTRGRGTGGHGVIGEGGSGDLETNVMEQQHPDRPGKFRPGAGVVGIGGYWIGSPIINGVRGEGRDFGGPGVVGVAGREDSPETYADYGSQTFEALAGIGVVGVSLNHVGVYADGKEHGIIAKGGSGIGINAVGDTTGVQGVGNIGVEGSGTIGVKGIGNNGGPGGLFSSSVLEGGTNTAQIHLDAQQMRVPSAANEVSAQYRRIRPTVVDQLPKTAQIGDLLLTHSEAAGDYLPALLWICTGGRAGAAVWQQVLLGEPIDGKR
jgi:hypothetical protein